jgi:hypothetical protein
VRALAAAALLCTGAAAAAAPLRVAIVPPGAEESAELERALVEAAQSLPGVVVANVQPNGRLAGARSLALDVRTPAARAAALARESGAARALVVDVAHLGEGVVVYLQSLDADSGKQLLSTTASLPTAAHLGPEARGALRGAVVRVLDPQRYVGHLVLRLDVKGAEVQVDGRPLTEEPTRPLELAVGTHALRVTHPAYHDFLRFIDVEFDKAVVLEVPLAAYPRAVGEMAERAKRRAAAPMALPWYRTWWALGAAGVILTGATIGIVYAARPVIESDRTIHYQATPVP